MKQENDKIGLSISDKKIEKVVIAIIVAVLCIPSEIRNGVLGRKLGCINYIAITFLIYLVYINIKNIYKKYMIFFYFIIIYYIFTLIFNNENLFNVLIVICVHLFPLILIGMSINDKIFKNIFYTVIKIINFIIILITVLGLMEFILGLDISLYISKFMPDRTQELILFQKQANVKRLYSFMGHPLFNTQLYLMFFVLNNIYNKYFEKILSDKILVIISVIGIAMTASKMGLILISSAILVITHNKSIIKKVVLISGILLIAMYTGIFNNTIERFMEGSITTGRAETWQAVLKSGLYPIKLLSGYGHEFTFTFNNYLPWASAAFEYPIRMFSLELGIVMAVLIYICIGVIPILILLKRNHVYLLISYMIIFIDVNSYNGLALASDYMFIFSIFIFIILNTSRLIKKQNLVAYN